MPAGCKRKSGVSTGTNGAPVVGDMRRVTCEVTYAICGKFFHRTQVETNRKGACQSFFASVKASLPKEQVCCDCYPKCCSGCDLSEAPTEPGLYNIPPGSPGKRDTTSKPPPKLDLSVAEDGKSMTGTYLNPYSNQQEIIYLTLEKKLAPGGGDNRGMYDDDWVTYYPNTVMYATGATKIYADASSASGVKMTLPAGTQMMMEHVILGPDGNPAWYFVTDNSSVGGTKWHGFVPAPMVRCPGVNQNRPPS